jgi:hypothetical protein
MLLLNNQLVYELVQLVVVFYFTVLLVNVLFHMSTHICCESLLLRNHTITNYKCVKTHTNIGAVLL